MMLSESDSVPQILNPIQIYESEVLFCPCLSVNFSRPFPNEVNLGEEMQFDIFDCLHAKGLILIMVDIDWHFFWEEWPDKRISTGSPQMCDEKSFTKECNVWQFRLWQAAINILSSLTGSFVFGAVRMLQHLSPPPHHVHHNYFIDVSLFMNTLPLEFVDDKHCQTHNHYW